jgi:hypothetical protein
MNSNACPIFNGEGGEVFAGCFAIFIVVLVLAINILYLVVMCKIFSKAGYHWALGLLTLVPVVGFFVPLYLAFAEWPIQKQLKAVRQQTAAPVPPQNFRTL